MGEGTVGTALLRRAMLLLAVAIIVAAMMTVSASPALATANPPSCESGQTTAEHNQPSQSARFFKHLDKSFACSNGIPPSQ
jgi:hypothetical protein